MERAEIEIMSQCAVQELTPEAVALIVREVARQALDDLLRRDDAAGPRSLAEADAARDRIADEIAELRTALRLRDGAPARRHPSRSAAGSSRCPIGSGAKRTLQLR